MRVLVTGGCGFIGGHLVDSLKSLGHEVIVIDDLSSDNNNFHFLDGVEYVHADIFDEKSIYGYFHKVNHVFHLAAEARIQRSIIDPHRTMNVNVIGTLNVLKACVEHKVKRITYSSTSSVYGLTDFLPTDEKVPFNCLNPYAVSKLSGEELVKCYNKLYNLDSCILRYFNVYGERSPVSGPYSLVIGIFLSQRRSNVPLTVVGSGESQRDFIYVGDVVDLNVKSMNYERSIDGEAFNVGFGVNISILDVAKFISNDIKYVPDRLGEAKATLSNNQKAQTFFGWKPRVWLLDWIRDTLR